MKRLFIFCLLALATLPLSAASLFVDGASLGGACSDTMGQAGGITTPWCTIAYSVTRISCGDTLNIRAATYTEGSGVTITGLTCGSGTIVTIQNYNGETVIMSCGGTSSNRFRVNGGSAYFTLQGFTITNCDHGIFIDGTSLHFTVQNMTVHDTGQEGIHIAQNSSFGLLQNNLVYNTNGALAATNGECFYMGLTTEVDNTNNITILKNTCHDSSDECIELKGGTHDITVDGNSCTNCLKLAVYNSAVNVGCIEVDEDNSIWASNPAHIIRNNTIHDNHTAVQLGTGSTAYNQVIWGTDTGTGFCALYTRSDSADNPYTRIWYENTAAVDTTHSICNGGGATIDSKNSIGPTAANGNLPYSAAYFVNPATGDFHLVPGATPIGNGVNTLSTVPTDKDGRIRPLPPATGAFELAVVASSLGGTAKLGGSATIH